MAATQTTNEPLELLTEVKSDSTSASRARGPGVAKRLSRFRYAVRLTESDDAHTVKMWRENGRYHGECTCKGWKYHEGPCAHLIWMWFRDTEEAGIINVARLSDPLNDHRDAITGEPMTDGGR